MERDNLELGEDRERTRGPEFEFGKQVILLIFFALVCLLIYLLNPDSWGRNIFDTQKAPLKQTGPVKSSPSPKLPANIE